MISDVRKQEYIKELEMRLEYVLLPEYTKRSQTIPKTLDVQIQQAKEKTRETLLAGEQENKKRLPRNNEELLR